MKEKLPPPTTISLSLTPSKVEGLPNVTDITFFSDRMEIMSEEKKIVIHFLGIAKWHRWGGLYRTLARLGLGVRGWSYVANRDWFHPPAERFFEFYTHPKITIYMPDESPELPYPETMFFRVQQIMRLGGFHTFDLG